MTANQPIPFDVVFNTQIQELLLERHGPLLDPKESLTISGEMSHGHVTGALRLEAEDQSSLLELAVRVELEPNTIDSPVDARTVCLDALDAVFASWLESERVMRLPPLWDAYQFETWDVSLRGEVTRPNLEAEADRWLAMADSPGEDGT